MFCEVCLVVNLLGWWAFSPVEAPGKKCEYWVMLLEAGYLIVYMQVIYEVLARVL